MEQSIHQIEDLEQTLNDNSDQELIEFAKEELQNQQEIMQQLYEEGLEELISIIDSDNATIKQIDENIANFEIRPGVGGSESSIFAYELFQMYQNYCQDQSFKFQIQKQQIEEGTQSMAIKMVKCKVTGYQVYKKLLCESGVHKVIRVPETEAKGRLHSSTAQVIVTPEIPMDFQLNEKDLEYSYMRSQGAGGQHVNTTDSACRIVHKPTQIQVTCQEDRSQHTNREIARNMIREKLFQLELEKHLEMISQFRSEQQTSGDRSDKIRTYNFPQDRITDHRLGLTLYGMKSMLNGDYIEEFIEQYLNKEKNLKIQRIIDDLQSNNN